MARTLEAEAPSNLASFTIQIIVAGSFTETIVMANVAAEGPTWRGTIADADSVGEAKLNYFFNGSAIAAGRFHVDISATDGTTSYARDLVKVELPFRNQTASQNLSNTTVGDVTAVSAALTAISATLAVIATYIDTEITTLINRLGLFTGTGVNTVLGFLKAIMSKAAATPSDVGGTFDASTDSVEAIRDRGDIAWISNESPTVVISATSPQLQTIDEDQTITIRRGDYTQIGLTVGTIAGRTGEKLFFTVREEKPEEYDADPLDAEALIQITEDSGALTVKESAWATSSDGSITVDDEVDGDIRIILKSAITTVLPIVDSYWYDVQKIRADGDAETVAEGRLNITADVTRRTTVA